jgi:hypothetical protein
MPEREEAARQLESDLDTAGNVKRDYWVRRRSAASAVAFRCLVLYVGAERDRGGCTVFMSAADRTF